MYSDVNSAKSSLADVDAMIEPNNAERNPAVVIEFKAKLLKKKLEKFFLQLFSLLYIPAFLRNSVTIQYLHSYDSQIHENQLR